MSSEQTANSRYSINSKHFSNRIDSDIVQLTKTLMVEYQIDVNEAKLIARRMVQRKLNSILSNDELEGIESIKSTTKDIISGSNKTVNVKDYARLIYELLKMTELN